MTSVDCVVINKNCSLGSSMEMETKMSPEFFRFLSFQRSLSSHTLATHRFGIPVRAVRSAPHIGIAIPSENHSAKKQKVEIFPSTCAESTVAIVDKNNNNTGCLPTLNERGDGTVPPVDVKRKVPSKSDDGSKPVYRLSPDPGQTVSASFHQKSARRGLSKHRGSQCTSMALAAILTSTSLPVDAWRTPNLDAILRYGDRLHEDLISRLERKTTDPRLALHEIPGGDGFTYTVPLPCQGENWFARDYLPTQNLTLVKSGEYYGQVNTPKRSCPGVDCADLGDTPMELALEKVFCEKFDGAVLTVGNVSGAVIMDRHGKIRYFDSHCNNNIGRLTLDGTAVLLTFDTVQEFVRYVRKRESNPYCRYELIGVRQNQL